MLGKLIKYEFKSTGKFMLLMYALLIALSSIMSVGLALNLDEVLTAVADRFDIGGLIIGLFAFLVVTVFVILNFVVICGMFFYAISRFKNNLLGDEGYLMNTLPVKVRDNILSKAIVSVIWTLAGFLVAVLSYFILFLGVVGTDIFGNVSEAFTMIHWSNVNVFEFAVVIFEMCLMGLVAIVNIYFNIYASMAIGYSADTHRTAKSIGVFILLQMATSVFETFTLTPFQLSGTDTPFLIGGIHMSLWYAIIVNLIEIIAFYLITHHFLSKKLNLQ